MTTVHPQSIVEDGVVLGSDITLMAGAILRKGTEVGDRVTVHPYAVIGGEPQDLRFVASTVSGVRIGAGTTIREFVTLNRATKPQGFTTLGENCFLMAGVHLAHDVQVGRQVIMANNVLLAGHVHVSDHVFIGGGAAVHQFCRVGEGAMVAGLARITLDIAPYTMVAERDEIIGLNVVGLKRRGLSRETIRELKDIFRKVFFTAGNIRTIAAELVAGAQAPETRLFLEFFTQGKRGFARARREAVEGAESE